MACVVVGGKGDRAAKLLRDLESGALRRWRGAAVKCRGRRRGRICRHARGIELAHAPCAGGSGEETCREMLRAFSGGG